MASGTFASGRARAAFASHTECGPVQTGRRSDSRRSSGIYSRLTLSLHSRLHGLGRGVSRADSRFPFAQRFELLPAADDAPRFALNSPRSAGMSVALVQTVP